MERARSLKAKDVHQEETVAPGEQGCPWVAGCTHEHPRAKQGTPKQEARTFLPFLASWRDSQCKCRMDLARRKGASWSSPAAEASGEGDKQGRIKAGSLGTFRFCSELKCGTLKSLNILSSNAALPLALPADAVRISCAPVSEPGFSL